MPRTVAPPPVLPDVLAPGLITVFCGSAVGRIAARRGVPYSGPGNKFWPTLRAIGLVPRAMAAEAFRELPRHGIGLTDLNKIESGADSVLSAAADDPEALGAKIARWRPRILAFTAKRPAAVFLGCAAPDYGLQDRRIGATEIIVLPSPSGLAVRYWDERWWRSLAQRHRAAARNAGLNVP